mgnify:CR=1 FL=1
MPPQQPSFSCRAMIHSAHRRSAARRTDCTGRYGTVRAALVAVQAPVEPPNSAAHGPGPAGRSACAGAAGHGRAASPASSV